MTRALGRSEAKAPPLPWRPGREADLGPQRELDQRKREFDALRRRQLDALREHEPGPQAPARPLAARAPGTAALIAMNGEPVDP